MFEIIFEIKAQNGKQKVFPENYFHLFFTSDTITFTDSLKFIFNTHAQW